jgi:para-aminobenzoate synthetase component I
MRRTIPLAHRGEVNWHALADEPSFLYRRLAHDRRAFLFIGELEKDVIPAFDHGRAHDWYYGHILYDLKNELEALTSRHGDHSGLPLQHWAVPRLVVEWRGEEIFLHVHETNETEGREIVDALFAKPESIPAGRTLHWQVMTPRDRYLLQAERLLRHIRKGDIYEVNYCIERRAHANGFDPFSAISSLHARTDAAFAGFYRQGDRFALCASPERYLHFNGDLVTAQPMKGTRPRSADPQEDARLADELANDAKERSENIMALDVARHDLSRIAASGSVKVEELCRVMSHPHVHQMISTVTARSREGVSPMDVIKASFPMASMTGAPKFRAMQLIDEVEDQRRGLFSGTLGYFNPDGTGDLNVVIRTVFYDAATGECRILTGSALTAACDPEKEWDECELKARSVIDALA